MDPLPPVLSHGGTQLDLAPEVFVQFTGGTPAAARDAILVGAGLGGPGGGRAEMRRFSDVWPERYWLPAGTDGVEAALAALLADPSVEIASPVYLRAGRAGTGLSFADRLVVRLSDAGLADPPAVTALLSREGLQGAGGDPALAGDRFRLARLGGRASPWRVLAAAAALSSSPLVAEATPDWRQQTRSFHALDPPPWHLDAVQAAAGWRISRGEPGVVVAVLDSGCDLAHAALAGQLVPGFNVFSGGADAHDDVGHGTACAGLVAAAAGAAGVSGLAPGCQVMPVRMLDQGHIERESDAAAAVSWAVAHGAKVISMSWEYHGAQPGGTSILPTAITAAQAAGVVLVASSGNDDAAHINYPASDPGVIAVGACNQAGVRISMTGQTSGGELWGSNFGPELNVVAPGIDIWTADVTGAGGFNADGGPGTWSDVDRTSMGDAAGDFFRWMNGTSAAAPMVAALAALILSVAPAGTTPQQVRTIIEQSADRPAGAGRTDELGFGRINVAAALAAARGGR